MAKPALGRGLGALLGGASRSVEAPSSPVAVAPPAPVAPSDSSPEDERVAELALSRIRACPFQPRKDFTEESLGELADSIREQGIVQPLVVRARDGNYELIAGERRWRAAQLAGLETVPAIVREADDRTALELALIENLQRENLNPIEEAQGYQQLSQMFQLKQEEIAARVGKSRVAVANALRLLKLAPELLAYVRKGQLSVGHAKVILGLGLAEEQKLAGERALKEGLNVRQTEQLVAEMQKHPSTVAAQGGTTSRRAPTRDTHLAAVEGRLRERLGTRVNLRYKGGKGALEIKFFSDDELERILEVVGVSMD